MQRTTEHFCRGGVKLSASANKKDPRITRMTRININHLIKIREIRVIRGLKNRI